MKKQLQQLIEWHQAFGVPFRTRPCPFDDSDENLALLRLRARLMEEEVKEWKTEAIYNADIDRRAKELADILYVVFGTIITEGLQDVIERVFDEVHLSNMSKLNDDGKPEKRADGKVLKGKNYKEPNLDWLTAHDEWPPKQPPMNHNELMSAIKHQQVLSAEEMVIENLKRKGLV